LLEKKRRKQDQRRKKTKMQRNQRQKKMKYRNQRKNKIMRNMKWNLKCMLTQSVINPSPSLKL
jgi:hypothetical protein